MAKKQNRPSGEEALKKILGLGDEDSRFEEEYAPDFLTEEKTVTTPPTRIAPPLKKSANVETGTVKGNAQPDAEQSPPLNIETAFNGDTEASATSSTNVIFSAEPATSEALSAPPPKPPTPPKDPANTSATRSSAIPRKKLGRKPATKDGKVHVSTYVFPDHQEAIRRRIYSEGTCGNEVDKAYIFREALNMYLAKELDDIRRGE